MKARNLYQKLPKPIKAIIIKSLIIKNKYILPKHIKSKTYSKKNLEDFNNSRQFGPQSKLCYAPFSSMIFSVFGKVSPCYATYDKVGVSYPENTIKQIWKSKDFNNIRQKINEGNLLEYCNFCHIPLLNKNYGSMLSQKYDSYHFYGSKYPSIMEFELSNRCNLECIMCSGHLSSSIRKNREKAKPLPLSYDDDFVTQLEEFIPHLKVAEFTGGDPFLIDIYYKIWGKIYHLNPNCNILITTNANTMNDKVKALIEKHKKFSFNISIDSLNKEVYESIRVNAIFENVMNNINTFIEYSRKHNTHVNLMICPLRKNWKELPHFITFCNQKDINAHFHTVVKPPNLSLWSLPASELDKIYNYLAEFNFPENSITEQQNKDSYLSITNLIKTWHKQAKEKELSGKKIQVTISEKLSQTEKAFIESIVEFYADNHVNEDSHIFLESSNLVSKLEIMFAKIPPEIDKNLFNSLKVDNKLYDVIIKNTPNKIANILVDHFLDIQMEIDTIIEQYVKKIEQFVQNNPNFNDNIIPSIISKFKALLELEQDENKKKQLANKIFRVPLDETLVNMALTTDINELYEETHNIF